MGLAEFFSEVKKGFSKPSSRYYVSHPVFQPAISDVVQTRVEYTTTKRTVVNLAPLNKN